MDKFKQLQDNLKIYFKDESILENAFIHRSYLNEYRSRNLISNERLEFLGDAVLELWVSSELYQLFADKDEGFLTNLRAKVVRTESLASLAQKLELGRYLFLSKGEEKENGRKNPSLLADTFEALTGAIFIDQGINVAFNFLSKNILLTMQQIAVKGDLKDAKTLFQEKIQARSGTTPSYKLVSQEGPDHHKIFTVAVLVNNQRISFGQGKSKQEAEQAAAKLALEKLVPKEVELNTNAENKQSLILADSK